MRPLWILASLKLSNANILLQIWPIHLALSNGWYQAVTATVRNKEALDEDMQLVGLGRQCGV